MKEFVMMQACMGDIEHNCHAAQSDRMREEWGKRRINGGQCEEQACRGYLPLPISFSSTVGMASAHVGGWSRKDKTHHICARVAKRHVIGLTDEHVQQRDTHLPPVQEGLDIEDASACIAKQHETRYHKPISNCNLCVACNAPHARETIRQRTKTRAILPPEATQHVFHTISEHKEQCIRFSLHICSVTPNFNYSTYKKN